MDRLICGDVGFGKTEVAMRAAFAAVHDGRQVAILAPTTVLSFQHFETFKKRFKGWPIEIRALNRFVAPADVKSTLTAVKEGKVDILIGTHRILSKDVLFKNLGLLIVDEEQKFGVTHKERIRKMRVAVDTLTLSATPIPRTLNMSLVGIRDLSFINTPPVDRLPTRTYTCKFDQETIRKAVTSEVARGGQIYFIHNRVQSIYGIADELRAFLPDVRIRVAHGQMEEDELEQTMVAFFNHEIDMLVCTTIVESGVDVPRANTIFVDNAHQLGLSQLYQLRGRVGRSKQRAYCYLLIPKGKNIDKEAQERLRVIQENTALGSGLVVAQHDLELRGAGNILGEEQSGTVDLVGYELYMDLLNETLAEAKGEAPTDIELEPEINLRIPALIPDNYISDIRLRLSYYKALSNIRSQDDLSELEDDLKDQFGPIPEQVLNLMGLMLLRLKCKHLGIKDLATSLKALSLIFTDRTPLRPEIVIQLAMRENKKYSIAPDSRLSIRMNQISIQRIFEELDYLETLV
jgi:transcription-repair coupling factor (superfamily II helicase)